MKLSTEPQLILSNDEYKAAKSSRAGLHKALDDAFELGAKWGSKAPIETVVDEPPTIDTPSTKDVLSLAEHYRFRSWEEIDATKPVDPIEIFRKHHLPVPPHGDPAQFDSMLMEALKHAARKFGA